MTLKSLKSFIFYLFDSPISLNLGETSVEYLLTGKLQTDILENRFGKYRQLNGSNYALTFSQLCNAEKEIRIKSKIGLRN